MGEARRHVAGARCASGSSAPGSSVRSTPAPPAAPVPGSSAIVASTPESTEAAATGCRRRAALRLRRGNWSRPTTSTSSTSAPRTISTTRWPSRPGGRQARHLREAAGHDADGAAHCSTRRRPRGVVATVPFVYRFHPMVRQARARVARLTGTAAPAPRQLPAGLDVERARRQLARRPRLAAGRRARSPTSVRTGATWSSSSRATASHRSCAQLTTAIAERARPARRRTPSRPTTPRDGEMRPVDTEDVAIVMFRTDRGVPGSVVVSQISPGRKNQLWFELDGADATLALRPGATRRAVARPARSSATSPRDPSTIDRRRARYVTVPAGHPQGYQDCFDKFVADTYAAMPPVDRCLDGLPTFADGCGRADHRRRAAVVGRAAMGRRRRRRRRRPAATGRTVPHEARFPHRLPAQRSLEDICAWAAAHDYEALEVAAWPDLGDRPFTATHLDVDEFDAGDGGRHAGAVRAARPRRARRSPTTTTTSIPTPPSARRSTSTCTAASTPPPLLGCPTVGTFVGRDPGRVGRGEPARRRAGLRAARRPRRRGRA